MKRKRFLIYLIISVLFILQCMIGISNADNENDTVDDSNLKVTSKVEENKIIVTIQCKNLTSIDGKINTIDDSIKYSKSEIKDGFAGDCYLEEGSYYFEFSTNNESDEFVDAMDIEFDVVDEGLYSVDIMFSDILCCNNDSDFRIKNLKHTIELKTSEEENNEDDNFVEVESEDEDLSAGVWEGEELLNGWNIESEDVLVEANQTDSENEEVNKTQSNEIKEKENLANTRLPQTGVISITLGVVILVAVIASGIVFYRKSKIEK